MGNNPDRGEFWRIWRIGAQGIAEMPILGLPENAIERFFEKSSEKRERFQKFWKYTRCGRFFQKSGTVFRIFSNIPDKA